MNRLTTVTHVSAFLLWTALATAVGCAGGAERDSRRTAEDEAFRARESVQTRAWTLRDVGGGGAVSAMTVVDGELLIGSDMSGVYSLANGADDFVARHEGLAYTKLVETDRGLTLSPRGSSVHIQGIAGAPAPSELTVATSQGGVIYRSAARGAAWEVAFDFARAEDRAQFRTKEKKLFFGPVAIGADGRTVVVGVGQPKRLQRGKPKQSKGSGLLKDLPSELKFKVLLSEDAGRTWERVDLCASDCPRGSAAAGHVVDVAFDEAAKDKQFWVATLGGLFLLSKRGGEWQSINMSIRSSRGVPKAWNVVAVAPSAKRAGDVIVLTSGTDPEGLLWQSLDGDGRNGSPTWRDVSGRLGKGISGVSEYGPFVKLLRSRVQPSELVVSGTKNDQHGVLFTTDFRLGDWSVVVDQNDVSTFAADAWTRFDLGKPAAFKGAGEIALLEDLTGVRSVFAAGFLGMVVRADRNGDTAEFTPRQIHTREVGGPGASTEDRRFQGAGEISLGSSKGGVLVDRADGPLSVFLYGDNGMFLSNDQGRSFSRPKNDWFLGTGGMILGDRVAVSYAKGNHLQKGDGGGLLLSVDGGRDFVDVAANAPTAEAFTDAVLARDSETLFGLARGEGVYAYHPEKGKWSNASSGLPQRHAVALHEAVVSDEQVLVAVVEVGGGTEFYLRYVEGEERARRWSRAVVATPTQERRWLPGKLKQLSVDDDSVVALSEGNTVRTGRIELHRGQLAIALSDGVLAPVVSVQGEGGREQMAEVEIAAVTACGDWVYAATSRGVWGARLDRFGKSAGGWSEMPRMAFETTWTIAADHQCNLYVGARGAGNYFLPVAQD